MEAREFSIIVRCLLNEQIYIYIYWIRGISFGNENIDRALFTSNRNSMKKRAILLYTSVMQSRSTRIAYKTDEFSIFFQRPSLESTAWEFTISKYPNNRCGRQIETKNFSGIETKTNNTRGAIEQKRTVI